MRDRSLNSGGWIFNPIKRGQEKGFPMLKLGGGAQKVVG